MENYRVKTEKKPTIFNKSLFIGLLAGFAFSIDTSKPVKFLLWGTGALAGCIAGFMEKTRMINDIKYGKEVKTPTFWNKDALLGGLLGFIPTSFIQVKQSKPIGRLLDTLLVAEGIREGAIYGKRRMQQEYSRARLENEFNEKRKEWEAQHPNKNAYVEVAPPENNNSREKKFSESVLENRQSKSTKLTSY